jgi:TldD protein
MDFGIDALADRMGDLAAKLDCDYAEVRLAAGSSVNISLSGDEVETFSAGDSIGGSVRVLKRGSWSFVSFNNVAEAESFLKKGILLAEILPREGGTRVKGSAAARLRSSTDCSLPLDRVSLDEKFHLIRKYNDMMRRPGIQTTRSAYRDVQGRSVFMNSEGSDLRYDRSYCGISLAAIARDGAVIQPFHDSVSGYGGFEVVCGREEAAERVVKTALDLLGAEPAPAGSHRVIVDPKLAGVFIHEAFGHLSEADFVHENPRMRDLMVLGRQFGPEQLNVYDDGSIPSLAGFIPFDDEGVFPSKTPLILGGALSGRLHSRETAEKMNEPLTGNGRALNVMRQPLVRMTNTYIEPGPHEPSDLFEAMDEGVYAVDVIGGQTNLEMFTFTSGYGYEIKGGRRGRMFKDIVLSGNVFHTLKNISMIASDLRMFGGLGGCGKGGQGPLPVSFGGPHMLIDNVLIGGRQ